MSATVAFFGHNVHDAAVKRRVRGFQNAGAEVVGFMMRRGAPAAAAWRNIDLGETRDGAYLQRLAAVRAGARLAAAHAEDLRAADLVYARNLDMLACARLAMGRVGARAPLVYECLDVHRLMTRTDMVGAAMRRLERRLLADCALLVVSSPGFLREYFDRRHPGITPALVLENRLALAPDLPPRPALDAPRPDRPLTIGWFGCLRCRRSMMLMHALADRFGDQVRIVLRGYPSLPDLPDFDALIAGRPNLRYGGRYAHPVDLADLYASVDVVWAGDFHDAGFNSSWLLPNRLYEGGYYGAPPIAPSASETGRWVDAWGAGFLADEPLETTVADLVARLIADPAAVRARRAALLALPETTFLAPDDELAAVLTAVGAATMETAA